jgi:SPP1 gp7 family putative phage head morphogenesis protein
MCGYCDVENKYKEPLNVFTEEDYERLIQGIAAGVITTQKLDFNTYQLIARKLSEGVSLGFGKDINEVQFGSADYKMLFDLRRNVYVFSGAKTYQEVREVVDLLVYREKNEIRSFSDFKKKAKDVLVRYNEEYLQAEYNSAIAQSRSASQWMEFEKNSELYPMLTYHTVGDGRVRPTHAALNNISRPVDDKFWNNYMPPNGWNCRCTVLQGDDGVEKTNLKGFKQPKDVPDIFMMNPGKDRIVFSPKHPYFKVEPKDKMLARNNFNLPIP